MSQEKYNIAKFRNQKFIHFKDETVVQKIQKVAPYIESRFKIAGRNERLPEAHRSQNDLYGSHGIFLNVRPSPSTLIKISICSYYALTKYYCCVKVSCSHGSYFYKVYKETPKNRINIERVITDINDLVKKENEYQRKLDLMNNQRKFNSMSLIGNLAKRLDAEQTKDDYDRIAFQKNGNVVSVDLNRLGGLEIHRVLQHRHNMNPFDERFKLNTFDFHFNSKSGYIWRGRHKSYDLDKDGSMDECILEINDYLGEEVAAEKPNHQSPF